MGELEEKLLEYYDGLIEKGARLANEGKDVVYAVSEIKREEEVICSHDSSDLLEQKGRIRQKILTGKLYDSLRDIDKTDESILESITSTVSSTILDTAFSITHDVGGLENITRDGFIQKFPLPNAGRNPLVSYLKSFILLEIIKNNPDKVSELEETSAYFPHRLFKKTKVDIDKDISGVLIELFSDGLIQTLPLIKRAIHKADVNISIFNKLGKYQIIPLHYKWADNNPALEQEIDNTFNKPEIKKEIFETLAECLKVIGYYISVYRVDKATKRRLPTDSVFLFPRTFYWTAMETIKNYALNQLSGSWEKHKYRDVNETELSRMIRLKPEVVGNQLLVSDQGATIYIKKDDKMGNTTMYLPLCALLLNRIYEAAKSNLEQQNNTDQQKNPQK